MASKARPNDHKLSDESKRLLSGSLLLLSTTVVAMVPLLLADQTKLSVLKIFASVVLSFLPGWLFVRFVVFRSGAVWDEYVLNLHRLGIDKVEHLPRPPRSSIYYPEWKARGGEHLRHQVNLYRQKFEAHYGKGTGRDAESDGRRLRADTFFPVLLATVVFAVGWVAVFSRTTVFSAHPTVPGDALCYAFMGAYLFTLQMLVRRFFQADLKASAYVNATVRTVSALVVVLAVSMILQNVPENGGPGGPDRQIAAIAFLIGFFPLVGLQALQKTAAVVLRTVVPSLRNNYPLSDLDGLSVWYEARLLELGIEDMQNLATANLVDVVLHSKVPVARLIDWVDQGILYLHLEPVKERGQNGKSARSRLRRMGIRSATSLEEAFTLTPGSDEHPFVPAANDAVLVERLRWVLNDSPDDGKPSVTESILKTLGTDTNLKHVRQWKQDWRRSAAPAVAAPVSAAPAVAATNGHAVPALA
ncbi:MAG: hypothetical protein ABR540_21290 [Acidimicrobiales bacterium]